MLLLMMMAMPECGSCYSAVVAADFVLLISGRSEEGV